MCRTVPTVWTLPGASHTRNRSAQITWVPARCNITYRPNGPIASMLYGDGFTQTRSYDNSYRLTGVTDSLAASLLRQLTYGYEGRDNLTSITDAQVPANNEVFGYTPRESVTLATGPYGSLAFTYDGVGNRVTAAANPGSGLVTDTYSHPATSNRLTSIAQGAGGTRAFTYDAAGNVTFDNRTGGGYGYTYDAAGRMASLTINGVLQAEYKYDFAGRQAVRRLPQLGVTLHSVFDAQGSRAGFSPQPPSHRKSPPQRHTNVRT
jgi:YD repeat-containing protein